MPRPLILIFIILLAFGGLLLASVSVEASPSPQATATVASQPTPTFDVSRLSQPPTVFSPAQADNGAQVYWGMCMACHGDHGQGLTDEWRGSFPSKERDCWQAGCHASDAPQNSFEIPSAGAPALVGAGKLARFSNAFEMQAYIQQNMPYFRTGALTSEEAWSLTAYILQMNESQPDGFALDEVNASAIPVHRKVKLPESEMPGALVLVGVLILAAIGLNLQGTTEINGILFKHKGHKGDEGKAHKSKTPFPPLCAWCPSCLGFFHLKRDSHPQPNPNQADATVRPNFFHHLHPPSLPVEQSRFRYTLGAGGLAVFLSLILLLTGMLEMYYYVPTPGQAAISVETLATLVPFGNLVRNLHYWSAQFLVIVITLHLLRVTLTGAYAPPRRFNHLLGLGLLVLVLLLDFTGYVLRWDEGIRWALVVGANLLKTIPWIGDGLYQFVIGGPEPGAAALTRFYAWHLFGLTVGAAILMVWHAFRVRRDGGIALPPPAHRQEKDRITRFELLRREVLAMTIAAVVLLLFSLLVPAPIEQPISESGALAGSSQAPWFFLWIQQLLKLGDPFLLGVLTPVLVIVVLGLIPYVLPNAKPEELGRWFPRGNRMAQALTVLILLLILALTALGAISG